MAKRRIEIIAEDICYKINKLNKRQLNILKKQCLRLTRKNCWWVEYEIKNTIIEIVNMRLAYLEKKSSGVTHERRENPL